MTDLSPDLLNDDIFDTKPVGAQNKFPEVIKPGVIKSLQTKVQSEKPKSTIDIGNEPFFSDIPWNQSLLGSTGVMGEQAIEEVKWALANNLMFDSRTEEEIDNDTEGASKGTESDNETDCAMNGTFEEVAEMIADTTIEDANAQHYYNCFERSFEYSEENLDAAGEDLSENSFADASDDENEEELIGDTESENMSFISNATQEAEEDFSQSEEQEELEDPEETISSDGSNFEIFEDYFQQSLNSKKRNFEETEIENEESVSRKRTAIQTHDANPPLSREEETRTGVQQRGRSLRRSLVPRLQRPRRLQWRLAAGHRRLWRHL